MSNFLDSVESGEPVDVLSMSDEQLESLDSDALAALEEQAVASLSEEEEQGADEELEEEGEEDELSEDEEEDSDEDPDSAGDDDADPDDESDEDVDDEDSEGEDGESEGEDDTIDAAELFAPLQAAGREVKIDNVADARQLMQMGVDYNRKMQAMKPGRKVLKLLDNHGLMDEQELNFLIDLKNKRPEAIAKLVKESGIDPLDIDTNSNAEYRPNTYAVGDAEVDLDSAIEDLRDSPHYDKTADIVSNKWDSASQTILANNPQGLRDFNVQVGNGMYDQISSVMEVERMMGRLDGLNDIQAYQKIGNMLYEMGKLKGTEPDASQQPDSNPKPVIKAPVERKPKADAQRNKKRKRAATPKAKPAKAVQSEYNPLSMSDEEFEAAAHKYL